MFLNGANIGTRHGRDIVGNVVRRCLRRGIPRRQSGLSHESGSLDLKKAGGPQKVGRSLVKGDNINFSIFADPGYRAEVEKIMRESPPDKVAYQTAEETFDNVLSGWKKICIKPDGELEFPGPIFIILGINEEELIESIVLGNQLLDETETDRPHEQAPSGKKALAKAESDHNTEYASKLHGQIDTIQEQLNRATVTNVATQEYQRFYNYAQALVVRKLESAIPRSKSSDRDDVRADRHEKDRSPYPEHCRCDGYVTRTVHEPVRTEKNLREQLAVTTVICAPWAIQFRMTVREADYDGRRGSAHVFVAPSRSMICSCVRRSQTR